MRRKVLSLLMIIAMLLVTGCNAGGQKNWPVEALGAEEFTFYADNANVFADDVLASDAQFLYVQLACDADISLSEDEIAIANDNADGICKMISNDYHDVLDVRSEADVAGAVAAKLGLKQDAHILIIGDATAEKAVYEEIVKTYNNVDYLNSQGVDSDGYNEIYDNATTAGWDAVIVANDVAAFHMQSFPFASE